MNYQTEGVKKLTETDLYPTGEKQDPHPLLMQNDFLKTNHSEHYLTHCFSISHKQGLRI